MENFNIENYVKELMTKARTAQNEISNYSQEKIDYIVGMIAYKMSRDDVCDELSKLALEETGYGNYESKIGKIKKKAKGIYYEIKDVKTVGICEELPNGLKRIRKPVGVIAGLIPVTQPEMTPVGKALFALKCRNAMIFCAHPNGKKTTMRTVEIMREVLKDCGAPEDALICADKISVAITSEIMKQADLVIATGGAGMVKAAYSSGTPAFGVGAGNACIVVDETADINDAAHKIMISKTGDYAAGCSCDNSVIIVEDVFDKMIAALENEGGYYCSPEETECVKKALFPNWPTDHALNRELIARAPEVIAAAAGINVPKNTKFIMVDENGSGHEHPFSGEKLSVVLAIYRCKDVKDGIRIVNENHAYSGAGHSCGIYSNSEENIFEFANNTKTTRCNVNLPNALSNSGDVTSGFPYTTSLGCGTWGGNVISQNICIDCYCNNTWIATPVNREFPDDRELFADLNVW